MTEITRAFLLDKDFWCSFLLLQVSSTIETAIPSVPHSNPRHSGWWVDKYFFCLEIKDITPLVMKKGLRINIKARVVWDFVLGPMYNSYMACSSGHVCVGTSCPAFRGGTHKSCFSGEWHNLRQCCIGLSSSNHWIECLCIM